MTRIPHTRLACLLLLMVAIVGCQMEPSAESSVTTAPGATNSSAASQSTAAGNTAGSDFSSHVILDVGDEASLKALLVKHRGKVILVDFWATWCGPCVKKFPHIVELAEQHADEGLAVIAVSMDDPENPRAVLEFLQNHQATAIDHVLGKYGPGTEFADAFEIRGDLPQYKLYDREGKLRYQFSADPEGLEHGRPIEEIDQRVKELLSAN